MEGSEDGLRCFCGKEFAPKSGVKCPRCTKLYCCQSCVNVAADWHARDCANPRRPLTTADSLTTAVFADLVPDDPETLEDYFFTRVRTAEDKTKLFGLYTEVIKLLDTKPSKLHEWRLSGKLGEHIKELYKTLPASSMGDYHAWFLQNLHLFKPLSNRPVPVLLARKQTCASCRIGPAIKQCSTCKKEWYCSTECQMKEWSAHRPKCVLNREITPADKLKTAARYKEVPARPEVIAGYGLDRVDEIEQKNLLEVYRIIFDEGVHPQDVERWKASGTLLKEVEKLLVSLPTWKTADTMDWFFSNRHAFDPTIPATPREQSEAARLLPDTMLQLWSEVGDSSLPCRNTREVYVAMDRLGWSESRRDFFMFRVLLRLEQSHPPPERSAWVQLGFCACSDEEEETFLALTYKMLADRCSYEEFFSAFDSSTLIALLDAKGLRGRRTTLPYLEDVLSGSPNRIKSVWNLKQHIRASGDPIPTPSLSKDYGFANCKSDSECDDLKEMYKQMLERKDSNPLELHKACTSGKLYEYAEGLFPELKKKKNRSSKLKRLMSNPYPLQASDEELVDAFADPYYQMPGSWSPYY